MNQENIPKLYHKQTGKEVPHVKGIVESATVVGTYQSFTRLDEVAKYVISLFDVVATMAELTPESGMSYSKIIGKTERDRTEVVPNRQRTTEGKLKRFFELMRVQPQAIALSQMVERLGKSSRGLELRLEGDKTLYFMSEGFYRVNRGEQVVLYSEFLPGGLADRMKDEIGVDVKPKEEEEQDKRLCLVGLQVVDEQGVLWNHVLNPDVHVFSDKPPEPELSKLKIKE